MARILLVEDDGAILATAAEILQFAGHSIHTASDGLDALALARQHALDLVLSDIMMPRLDGLGMAAALRADATLAPIPIILFSGGRTEPAGLGTLYDAYLPKPFDMDTLLALVVRFLEPPVPDAA